MLFFVISFDLLLLFLFDVCLSELEQMIRQVILPFLSSTLSSSMTIFDFISHATNKIHNLFQNYLSSITNQSITTNTHSIQSLQQYFHNLNSNHQTNNSNNNNNNQENHFFGHVRILHNLLNLIKFPLKYSELYSLYRIIPLNGILLYGPPGTGKTHLVRSLLNYLPNYSFINVELSDVLSGVIGGSEQRIRDVFQQAKSSSPSILFIDEFQALFSSTHSSHSSSSSNESDHTSTLLSTLIYCLDDLYVWNQFSGLSSGQRVVLMAATNEPWKIPENILFKLNRFNKLLFIEVIERKNQIKYLNAQLNQLPGRRTTDGNFLNAENVSQINFQKMRHLTFADLNFLLQKLFQIILIEREQNEGSWNEEESILKRLNEILESFVGSCSEEDLEEFQEWEREIKQKKKSQNLS